MNTKVIAYNGIQKGKMYTEDELKNIGFHNWKPFGKSIQVFRKFDNGIKPAFTSDFYFFERLEGRELSFYRTFFNMGQQKVLEE